MPVKKVWLEKKKKKGKENQATCKYRVSVIFALREWLDFCHHPGLLFDPENGLMFLNNGW